MIKGLYFKLNLDNPKDEFIHDFFLNAPKYLNVTKIEVLYHLCASFNNEMNRSTEADDNERIC